MTDILSKYVDLVDVALGRLGELLYRLFGRYLRRVRLGPIDLELRSQATRNYSEVLERLDKAGTHLSEALDALEVLRIQYSNETVRVLSLRREIDTKRNEQREALTDLEATRQLLATDKKRLKAALGLDDRRTKVAGFVSGVLASIIAALLFQAAPVVWSYLSSVLPP